MRAFTLGALILAGGQNRRMGGDPKALLPNGSGARILDGLCLALGIFEEKLLSTNDPALAAGTDFVPVADAHPGMGPLAGLAAALTVCKSDGLVVAACDMPCFDRAAAGYLASFADRGWPAWALRDRTGRLHPLCGVYTKQCLPAILAALEADEHRVGRLFQAVGGQAIPLEGTPLPDTVVCNVNTPEELEALLAQRQAKT